MKIDKNRDAMWQYVSSYVGIHFKTLQLNPFLTEVFPRDLRQKEKFLKHLTGEPVSISLTMLVYFCAFITVCIFLYVYRAALF